MTVFIELSLLAIIYSIWILSLVNAMVASEEISLMIPTLTFIVTFPIALLLSVMVEVVLPGVFNIDILLTMIIGVLFFVRWIMAVVGE